MKLPETIKQEKNIRGPYFNLNEVDATFATARRWWQEVVRQQWLYHSLSVTPSSPAMGWNQAMTTTYNDNIKYSPHRIESTAMKDAETPRTDAITAQWNFSLHDMTRKGRELLTLSQQLERELAPLRAELDWVRDVTAEHGYDGPQGEACSPLRDWLREWAQLRRESAEPYRENARLLERELAAANLEIAAAHKDVRDTEVRLAAANEKLAQLGGEVGILRIDISNERKARKEAESAKGTMPWVQALERRAKAAEAKLTAMDRENARLLGEIAATCLKRKEDLRRCERIARECPFSPVAGMEIGNVIRKEFPEDFKDD